VTRPHYDGGSGPAPGAPLAPRRYRRSTTARSHAFGVIATAALLVPGPAAVAWAAWHGIDGGLVVVWLIAAFLFAIPPVAAGALASTGQVLTRAACAVGGSAPFIALALGTADGRAPGPAAPVAVAVAAALALGLLAGLARRGGLLTTGVLSVVVLLGFVAPGLLDRAGDALGAVEGAEVGAPAGADGRLRAADVARVRLGLSGPLRSAVIRADGLAPLELEVDLVAGEALDTFAWIAAPRDRARFGAEFAITAVEPPSPEGANPPTGAADEQRVRVRFDEPAAIAALRDHPLAGRPRPALPREARATPSFEALLCAWAALFLVAAVASRLGSSRPWIAVPVSLAVGGLGALGVALLSDGGQRASGVGTVRVLDGEIGAGGDAAWLQVERFRGGAVLATGLDAPLVHVEVADGRPWGTRLTAREGVVLGRVDAAPGVGVDLLRAFSPGLRLLQPEVNAWGDLEAVWTRDRAGSWSVHGPWPLGERLPDAVGEREPPAWCLIGLKPSTGAIAGLFGGGTRGGTSSDAGGAGPDAAAEIHAPRAVWIRLTRD